jgi:catecholate siderophore receptor
VDLAIERKQVDAVYTAAQGGVVPVKPNTTVGAADDGAWVDESLRSLRRASDYRSKAAGAYVQNLALLRPDLKLLTGLRFDHLDGDYFTNTIPANAAGPVTRSGYRMTVNQWSQRLGAIYQPSPLHSFHASAATSFNTSGDAYSLSAANQNLPPEKAINLELGAKLDDEEGRFSTRFAIFRSTKLNERNTDPLNTNVVTLSGKRHAAGFEMDVTGRLGEGWEVYGSYMWMPFAKIDISSAALVNGAGELQGDRPSLSPRHTGSLWVVRQVNAQWRSGLGLTGRSSQTPNRNPGFAAPGFVSVDTMAEFKPEEDGASYRLNISNLANHRYADALYTAHYVPGTGRVVTLTASLPF